MYNKFVCAVALSIFIVGCSPVPNTSVFENLSTQDLAKVLEVDPSFESMYLQVTEGIQSFNEIDKAKFNDITWKKLYAMHKYSSDSLKIAPLFEQWTQEWIEQFGQYDEKVDSVIAYWQDYKNKNSLDRFVRVEFAEIDKEYYSYSFDVKEVNLGFKLIPVDGRVEQVKFNYRYSAKINNYYGDRHNCISTSPFSVPVVRYWGVGYDEEKTLKNLSTAAFIRDYDIQIEVTDVRKDGVNYSVADLDIPESVRDYFNNETTVMSYYYRTDIIRELLCPSFKPDYEYVFDKWEELMTSKFPREHAFMKLVEEKD